MSHKLPKGFTLLELLIALFIFTIISVIMVNALHTVFTNQTSTNKSAARLAELQVAFTYIERDFEQILDRPITTVSGSLEPSFLGIDGSVTFTHAGAANPLGQLQRSTLQRTRYRLQDGTLLRDTWAELDQTAETPINTRKLLTGVSELRFEYLDTKNNFHHRFPPPDQPPTNVLPKGVRVYITLKDLGKMSQFYVIPTQKDDKPN